MSGGMDPVVEMTTVKTKQMRMITPKTVMNQSMWPEGLSANSRGSQFKEVKAMLPDMLYLITIHGNAWNVDRDLQSRSYEGQILERREICNPSIFSNQNRFA
ncbi:hypothetical protein BH09BAC3_BH09BAC3_06990 [soil metagenome]